MSPIISYVTRMATTSSLTGTLHIIHTADEHYKSTYINIIIYMLPFSWSHVYMCKLTNSRTPKLTTSHTIILSFYLKRQLYDRPPNILLICSCRVGDHITEASHQSAISWPQWLFHIPPLWHSHEAVRSSHVMHNLEYIHCIAFEGMSEPRRHTWYVTRTAVGICSIQH